ncbi:MAG: response regulator transcription factor [Saprospiraceae bacterium]|nr:response regulator transcription factor [Saprospiraceae bacterium]
MDSKLRCVVLEDEPGTRADLISKLMTFEEIEVVGEAESIKKGFVLISDKKPDSAFMDIKLIGGDIFILLEKLKTHGVPIPNIVITTGFNDYLMTALNEYHNFVVQYLMKPYKEDWEVKLGKAIDALQAARIRQMQLAENMRPLTPDQYTFVHSDKSIIQVRFDDVVYIESGGDGKSGIVTHQGVIMTNYSLIKCNTELFPSYFMRISKSHIVNLRHILKINKETRNVEVMVNGKLKKIAIGETYYKSIVQNLI